MRSPFYLSALLSISAAGICEAAPATSRGDEPFDFSLAKYDTCLKQTYAVDHSWDGYFCSMPNFAIIKNFEANQFTRVFLAWDSQSKRQAVVKLVHSDYEEVYRLEKCLLTAVRSPLIPQLYCTMFVEPSERFPAGGLAIVMEYLEGRDLTVVINNEIAAGVPRQYRWIEKNWHQVFLKVGGFIQSMHRHGLIHRDIKPENIILLNDGSLRVIDFGFSSKVAHPQPVRCTLNYTCPKLLKELEQHAYELINYEPFWTTDFYAFGMTLLVLVEGGLPWDDSEDEYDDGVPKVVAEETLCGILKNHGNLGKLLAGFLNHDPSKRWTFDQALEFYNGIRW